MTCSVLTPSSLCVSIIFTTILDFQVKTVLLWTELDTVTLQCHGILLRTHHDSGIVQTQTPGSSWFCESNLNPLVSRDGHPVRLVVIYMLQMHAIYLPWSDDTAWVLCWYASLVLHKYRLHVFEISFITCAGLGVSFMKLIRADDQGR